MKIRSILSLALISLATIPLAVPSVAAAAPKKAKLAASASKPAAKPSKAATAAAAKQTAAAKPAAKKEHSIALGALTGRKPKDVRGWLQEALSEQYEVTDAEDVTSKGTDESFAKFGKDLGVDYIVTGVVQQNKLLLTLRSGADGAIVKNVTATGARGPKLKKAIGAQILPGLEDAIEEHQGAEEAAAAEAAKAAEAEKAAAAAAAPADEGAEAEGDAEGEGDTEGEGEGEAEAAKGPTASPLSILGGARFYRRTLSYSDIRQPMTSRLFDYKLPLGPTILLRLQAYPAGLLGGDGFLTNIGIIGGFEQGVATKSQYRASATAATTELTNSVQAWFVGARVRFPSPTFEFGTSLSYGQHKYSLDGDEGAMTGELVPDVKYSYAELGVDAQARFGSIIAGGHLNGRVLFGTGELESAAWFPNASGKAIDVGVFGGYALFDSLDVLVGIDLLRYGFDFNPVPTDALRVAGGAVDQYLSGWLGVRFNLEGRTAAAGAASADAEAGSESEPSTESAATEEAGEEDAEAGEEDAEAGEEDAEVESDEEE